MQRKIISAITLVTIVVGACSNSEDTSISKTSDSTKAATAAIENVEITLIDMLGGVTSSYCLDIAGGNKNIDISKGLQAHTCYSYRGEIGTDQTFETSRFMNNELYMPDFDVCATVKSLEAGSAIGLANCDGSELQKINFSGNGTISMIAAPDLCFTAAIESRFGRSEVHQIKALSLENCASDMAAYQEWRGRASAD